jgi:hypothetical protein
MLTNAAEMTPEERLTFIQDQILQVRAGELKWMLCPYCGEENYPSNEFLCCKLFFDATGAILDRLERQDAIDFMANVADRAIMDVTKKHVN